MMFANRESAGKELAKRLAGNSLRDPVVLAVPNGGLFTGAALAEQLGAELDVVLTRKLPTPFDPNQTIGAVSEHGQIFLEGHRSGFQLGIPNDYVLREATAQLDILAARRRLVRHLRRPAPLSGRTVIVADDIMVTGATILATLKVVRCEAPFELIVAVPVAPQRLMPALRELADDAICLCEAQTKPTLEDHYEEHAPISDREMAERFEAALAKLNKRKANPSNRSALRPVNP